MNATDSTEAEHRRCGHLACGTYCSLRIPGGRLGDNLFNQGTLEDVHLGNLLRKHRMLRDVEESCSIVPSRKTMRKKWEPMEDKMPDHSQKDPDEPFLASAETPSGEESSLPPKDIVEQMQKNPHYLAQQLCQRLKQYDRYNRGIVSAKDFIQVLNSLGLTMPSAYVNDVLEYCIVTCDGFVVYKPLHRLGCPNRSEPEDHLRRHFCPPAVWKQDIFSPACPAKFKKCWADNSYDTCMTPTADVDQKTSRRDSSLDDQSMCHSEPRGYFSPRTTDSIRRLFAMWDRCLINDEQLKHHLKLLGVSVTKEAETLIGSYSASRSLSFSKFLHAMQINMLCCYRKNRSHQPSVVESSSFTEGIPGRHGALVKGSLSHEGVLDPISWRARPVSFFLSYPNEFVPLENERHRPSVKKTDVGELFYTGDENHTTSFPLHKSSSVTHDKYQELLKLLADTESNRLSPSVLREKLTRLGLVMTPQINHLLNQKEAGTDVSFSKFVVALCRAPFCESRSKE